MARTYTQFVDLVRNWSNKDSAVLSDDIIKDCLRYAADKAYRKLRVIALENTISYNSTDLIAATTAGNNLVPSKTEITVPSDLIEFIEIREVDAANQSTRVFNEKTDLRTFNDWTASKYNYSAFWTRRGNTVILSPAFQDGIASGTATKIELHYYRRLPALDALYNVTPTNYTAGLLNPSSQGVTGAVELWFSTIGGVATPYATQAEAIAAGGTVTSAYYLGQLAYNWLRDDNERILLMGSLGELFAYLQDDEQAQKYFAMFAQEIDELNDEDNKRGASGGNIQMSYSAGGLI